MAVQSCVQRDVYVDDLVEGRTAHAAWLPVNAEGDQARQPQGQGQGQGQGLGKVDLAVKEWREYAVGTSAEVSGGGGDAGGPGESMEADGEVAQGGITAGAWPARTWKRCSWASRVGWFPFAVSK